jgi:3',5'-nucleoside bisphosphate phosphatase
MAPAGRDEATPPVGPLPLEEGIGEGNLSSLHFNLRESVAAFAVAVGATSPGKADLHVHSTASDGKLSPTEVVAYAAGKGVTVLALTDHDSLAGLEEAAAEAARRSITFIAGVELTSSAGGREAHLLGYFVDRTNADLLAGLRRLQERRANRGRETVDRLGEIGYPLSWEQVQAIAAGSVGRPHIARALVSAGYAADISEAFARFLSEGAPAYIPAPSLAVAESIAMVRAAGGVPVLAHPIKLTDIVPGLVAAGLRGIEVYYGAYSNTERRSLAALAEAHGLLQTGGSDFHGLGNPEGHDLGSVAIPAEHVGRLLAH